MSSESNVEVVRIGAIRKHQNADSLSITDIHGGYPVIFRTGDYAEGDLAVYVPIDSIVPDTEAWAFLGGHRRIKAKRLRGVFSMGMLAKAPDGLNEGHDVRELLEITKWEPEIERDGKVRGESLGGEPPPKGPPVPVYDVEGWRKWKCALTDGEEIVATEKIHGANARVFFDGDRLWVGSRTQWKAEATDAQWWPTIMRTEWPALLAKHPDVVVFGEVFGQVQDLKYGHATGSSFRAFDIYDRVRGEWYDHDRAIAFAGLVGIPWVPILYRGPWNEDARSLAEGKSTFADHVREGIVVKPVRERRDKSLGRVILKLVGEGYLLRKTLATCRVILCKHCNAMYHETG